MAKRHTTEKGKGFGTWAIEVDYTGWLPKTWVARDDSRNVGIDISKLHGKDLHDYVEKLIKENKKPH